MKTYKLLLFCLSLTCAAPSTQAQGTFQNLDFESANVSGYPSESENMPFGSGMPGWMGYISGVQQTNLIYNTVYMDFSGISILDPNSFGASLGFGVIEGNYMAVLQAGLGLSAELSGDTSLVQSGLIPGGTQSLRFSARPRGSGSFSVSLGGQNLLLVALGNGGDFTFYAADIHSWAGQTAELSFTAYADVPHIINNYLSLDSISFSSEPVPEPSMLGLLALGGLLLRWQWQRNQKK